jgi:hypothetical protein
MVSLRDALGDAEAAEDQFLPFGRSEIEMYCEVTNQGSRELGKEKALMEGEVEDKSVDWEKESAESVKFSLPKNVKPVTSLRVGVDLCSTVGLHGVRDVSVHGVQKVMCVHLFHDYLLAAGQICCW